MDIYEAMVNKAKKNYSSLLFLPGSSKNDSGGSGLEQ